MTPIVITPPEIIQNEVHLWEALFLAGLERLHVRKPEATLAELKDMLTCLPIKYHSRLVLHQHFQLTDEFNLGGLHFKSTMQAAKINLDCTNLSLSKSCHTPLEVLNNYQKHDYVFLSPIFDSISKKGYPSAFYTNEIKSFFQDNPQVKNCIALGGVSAINTQECLDLGFASCALLGAIWEGENLTSELITNRFQNIQANYKPAVEKTAISSFQFITNDFSELDELEQIKKVCESGAKWMQVRLKNQSDETILKMGREAAQICSHYNAKLIINDHVHLVKEIGAHGVHLGKADMSPVKARELLGSNYIIGGTANNMNDVRQLHKAGVNYIGLGPFRFTQTKKNLAPVLGLSGYKEIIQNCLNEAIDMPIVAIGGIKIDDVTSLMSTGIHGIALSSSITQAEDITNTSKKYLKQLINPLCKS